MDEDIHRLSDFLSEVVMTGYYIAEPPRKASTLLHDAEMKCLKIIHAFGPMQMHDIASLMFATKPRATQLVAGLEARGLVERKAGADHRVKEVNITETGRQTVYEAREKYRALARAIEEKIGSEKTHQLCMILEQITPLTTLERKGKS